MRKKITHSGVSHFLRNFRNFTSIIAALFVVLFFTSVLAEPTQHCINGNGACSTDIDSVLILSKGVAQTLWVGSMIKKGRDYICMVVYLSPLDTSGFVAKTGRYGILEHDILLTESLFFRVTAKEDNAIGFFYDGTKAKGPLGQNKGPHITVKCTSYSP